MMLTERPTIEEIQIRKSVEIEKSLSLNPDSIVPDTAMEPLGIDSLRLISLIIAIHKQFGVDLVRTGLKPRDLKTVHSLAIAIDAGQKP